MGCAVACGFRRERFWAGRGAISYKSIDIRLFGQHVKGRFVALDGTK